MPLRLSLPAPGCRQPRALYFLVRYDWETKETSFFRYDDPNSPVPEDLGANETLHRCSVVLEPTPGDAPVEAVELYIENDRLKPEEVTAIDALYRANPSRLFPVLPSGNVTMNTAYFQRDPRKAAMEVTFAGRAFIVTVEDKGEQ